MNRQELFLECMYCKKRYIGCHATCESYKKDREKLDDYNEQIKDNKKHDNAYYEYKKNKR